MQQQRKKKKLMLIAKVMWNAESQKTKPVLGEVQFRHERVQSSVHKSENKLRLVQFYLFIFFLKFTRRIYF